MKIKNSLFFINILIFFRLIYSSSDYCNNTSLPILLSSNNSCLMKYCTEEEFSQNICIKDNHIIKTQWLNNIREFGEENCRITKIFKYSNEDMVTFCVIEPGVSKVPSFYGIKNNGRPLFIQDEKETPYINFEDNNDISYYDMQYQEGEVFMAKMSDNGEEYPIFFSKETGFTELYDFEELYIYSKKSNIFFQNKMLESNRSSVFQLKDSNYFLFSGILYPYNSNFNFIMPSLYRKYLYLFKINLQKKAYLEGNNITLIESPEKIEVEGNMISCFQCESKYIVCFYLHSIYEKKYKIIMYEENTLSKLSEETTINVNTIDKNIFFKAIHYDKEIGIFIYYNNPYNNYAFPIISFREQKDETIIELERLNNIELKEYIFNTKLHLNDLIKLSDDIICFSSVSTDKETLYIVTLNIFEDNQKVKIRYYVIRTFGLYQYKFYLDLNLIIYKGCLSLASSFCKNKECSESNSDTHYSSLIIFSYPNSIDINKNIVEVLFEENKVLEDLIFNLNLIDNVLIDNNIFGLVYSKIIIESIENCDNITLSKNGNEQINFNSEILYNEYINIKFNNYDSFICKIGYIYEITEPDYASYDEFPETIDITYGNNTKEDFINYKKTYSGKLSYYSLYLNDSLTKYAMIIANYVMIIPKNNVLFVIIIIPLKPIQMK